MDKPVKPLVGQVLLVENPSTKGFFVLSAQQTGSSARLGQGHCSQVYVFPPLPIFAAALKVAPAHPII
ncbi:hypothetical protein ACIBKZ_33905 [Streptomyces sp. NPDC050421]|uniref:hypothetical protein n=1 Tax=Streptomyces sp. NPDC050421 TaxID=3365613 RepID=UPI00379FB13D